MQKKRVFISYRFTGENSEELKNILTNLGKFIKKSGLDYYSTIFDSDQFANKKWSGKKILQKAFREIDSSDIVLFFVRKPEISQGMLVELGYSIAKDKKLILAIQTGIKESIFRRQIGTVIEFDNIEELKNKLENMLLKE